jgi:catechol 2,3-dioxygenase-like lactoylglutathione lyase family enzyme
VTDRLDHVVIAVRDLDAAIARYGDALGFAVTAGGLHVGRGTHNAIVRFGLDYLELISVYAAAEATHPAPATLVRYLAEREGGLVGFALATADLDALAARLRETGLDAEGPFAMARERPDGRRLSWRLLVPGGVNWRQPWPFFIQWDHPDAERLAWEAPGGHANGARGVQEVAVVVADLARGVDLYARQIGLPLLGHAAQPALGADSATLAVGAFRIVLLAPAGAGFVADVLAADGEGPFQAMLGVDDLEATRRVLAARGVPLTAAPGVADGWLIDPATALGARLVLRAASA